MKVKKNWTRKYLITMTYRNKTTLLPLCETFHSRPKHWWKMSNKSRKKRWSWAWAPYEATQIWGRATRLKHQKISKTSPVTTSKISSCSAAEFQRNPVWFRAHRVTSGPHRIKSSAPIRPSLRLSVSPPISAITQVLCRPIRGINSQNSSNPFLRATKGESLPHMDRNSTDYLIGIVVRAAGPNDSAT